MRNQTILHFGIPVIVAVSGVVLVGCPRQVEPLPDVQLPDLDAGPDLTDAGDGGPPPEGCTAPGSTLGTECTGNAACNDGCFCNGLEECRGGTCQAGTGPCREDEHACTSVTCAESTNRCSVTTDDSMCTNSNACDGLEVCNPSRGCSPGPAPVCNDETSCTVDSCDMATGCVYTPRDLDMDGYVASSCEGGTDCDDDPRYGTMIYPGAEEICDNRRDDDCDGRRDFNDEACAPTNDTCDVASVLTLGPMGGTFSGATTGLRHNYTLGCGGGSGPDAIFRFNLAEMRDVRISATAAGAAVALRPFDQCASGPDDKCNTGSPPTVLRRSLPPGEYAIIVSTTTAQAFDLTIRLTDPTVPPPVDVCGSSTTLIPITGGMFSGRFEEVEDDYSLSCNGTSTRDAVYAFEIPPGGSKNVTITGSTTGGSWSQAYIALTSDCADRAAYLLCETDGTSTTVERRGLGPGRYYIIVEPSATDATDYSLSVTLTDPLPGDVCSLPADVTPAAIPGTRTVGLDVSRLALDSAPSCGPAGTGRDGVWTFTTTAVQDVTLTVSGVAGTIYGSLQTTCGTGGLRCTTGSGTLSQNYRSLPAGTYYFVAQTTAASGTMNLAIDVRAPTPIPMNDRCPGITITSPTTRTDTTADFTSEVDTGTCSGSGRGYPDAFYQFTLAARSRIVATASRPTSGAIYLGVTSTCASPTALACDSSGGMSASVSTTLDPGTYFLFVETPATAPSDFTLDFVAF